MMIKPAGIDHNTEVLADPVNTVKPISVAQKQETSFPTVQLIKRYAVG